ncbi:MAG: ATP-grasp domain-containing protein [Proteobacteria bacterium]|nr:ATP-grasp domain-containing protein [Pseudomonadota bacterium]
MQLGILGLPEDPHIERLVAQMKLRGVEGVVIDSSAKAISNSFSISQTEPLFNQAPIRDISVLILRGVLSPVPYVIPDGKELRLYSEWYPQHMRARGKHGFLISWLLAYESRGGIVMNPVEFGQIGQLKPFHTWSLGQAGIPLPPTCMTSSPEEAREFIRVHGECIYKPIMGGDSARPCDEGMFESLRESPQILQRRIRGDNIRVTLTCDKILSAVKIPSDTLDYRDGSSYAEGMIPYEPLKPPPEVERMCFKALDVSGYYYSGIDLIRENSGDWVMLEANSAPIYADIEKMTGAPISAGLIDTAIALAKGTREKRRPSVFLMR